MVKKKRGIRILLSFKLGYFLRNTIKMERIINQLVVANIKETLQLMVAWINGRRANEFLENIISVKKLNRIIPTTTNQASLKPRYFIRLALLKKPIFHNYTLTKGIPCFA